MNKNLTTYSGKKKEPKPKLFRPDIFGWGGGLPREGVGAKKFGTSLEPGKPNFFGGISRDFAGISRRCPKSLRKKSLCSIFVPYICCKNKGKGEFSAFCLFIFCLGCEGRELQEIASWGLSPL